MPRKPVLHPSALPRRIVVTGSPATGKTAVARALAEKLGITCVGVNEFAVKNKLYRREKGAKELVVDISRVAPKLRILLHKLDGYVVEGHLACEFALPCDAVAVLRCNPSLLKRRYAKRKYAKKKSDENLLAEMLDYCLVAAEDNYGREKIVQVDLSARKSVDAILSQVSRRASDRVSFLSLLATKEFSALARS
jgi:adenylate kinase